MRESRPYGSERGAFSNGRPYRDRTSDLREAAGPSTRAGERMGEDAFQLGVAPDLLRDVAHEPGRDRLRWSKKAGR